MSSDLCGPDRYKSSLRFGRLFFTETYESDHSREMKSHAELLSQEGMEFPREMYLQRLKDEYLYAKSSLMITSENIFYADLKQYSKDFKSFYDIKTKIEKLNLQYSEKEEQLRKLTNRNRNPYRRDDLPIAKIKEELERLRYEITNLHLDKHILLEGAANAFNAFSESERNSLAKDGYITVDIDNMYQISLMFHDAIEMLLALRGDERAFNRILGKFHMEYFDVECLNEECFDMSAELEDRLILWFESCGYDNDNPGTNLEPHEFETDYNGVSYRFRRKSVNWDERENYGHGRKYFKLCDSKARIEYFEWLVYDNLQFFLNKLIDEGLNRNYKNRFADPAKINTDKPIITVNDFRNDLIRTLWAVMDEINRGNIPFSVTNCKHCGRLIDTSRSAGNKRQYCDSSCRSQHSKRMKSQQNNGQENYEVALRKRYKNYLESGKTIRIGIPANIGKENTESEDSPNQTTSVYQRFKRMLKSFIRIG